MFLICVITYVTTQLQNRGILGNNANNILNVYYLQNLEIDLELDR